VDVSSAAVSAQEEASEMTPWIRGARGALYTLLLLGSAAIAEAQETPEAPQSPAPPSESEETAPPPPPPPLELPPITVTAPPPVAASSELLIPGRDFELRPQGRPADILRSMPGLLMGQHQGGGKAEQYLLRGFDADHGTDIALFVDGLPVNLRSHAHGQGYADLHFLIPETVRQVETFKGPYFVEFGDFATAGAVNFITLDFVPENVVQAAGGSWGTQRYLTLLSPLKGQVKTLLAMEVYTSNGPFVRDQDYVRLNAFAKASASLNDIDWALWTSYNISNWFAAGEIPVRAVREGLITRFGSIDDSQGGTTLRFNGNFDVKWRLSDADTVSVHGYGQYYQLNLYSDFTFFLDDPVNGDQIKQVDTNRAVAGTDLLYTHRTTLFGTPLIAAAGFQFRVDTPRVVLEHTHDRHLLDRTQDVNIFETSYSPLVKFDLAPTPWLRIVTGARGDIFDFNVRNNLVGVPNQPNGSVTKAIPSAKFNAILGPWYDTEFFANVGTGFHSNDARAVVQDPHLVALAQATGWEFGVRTKVLPNVEASFTYWWLNLSSELVFNGDTATLEPEGASHRNGFEFALRAKLLEWLTFTGNVTNTPVAEFFNGAAIPLAPRLTAYTDLTARFPWGLSASTTMRFVGPRYADEERTQTARGYTLVDLGARYRYNLPGGRAVDVFLTIENLFNVTWREAQFYYTSRLQGEPAQGVNDIHYTPGNPRTFLGGLAFRF
jgi:outer membrane receptor protein involved in Fe transport